MSSTGNRGVEGGARLERLVGEIQERLDRVRSRIAMAAQDAGRDPEEVRLVVVTKAHPIEVARAAVAAGVHRLGESYPEEAAPKIDALREESDLEWHMVGHIQSRKANLVAGRFKLVHSLDRLKLARRLDRFARQSSVRQPVLLQYNVSGERSKHGWPADDPARWPELVEAVGDVLQFAGLEVRGLMTIPPLLDTPEQAGPYFRRLCELRDFLARQFPDARWDELSMGMSHDFEAAIREGSTIVRIGQAILGPRP